MRELTDIMCPISGGRLVYIGSTSNEFVHYYESELNLGIRYRRYRLDWSILEFGNGLRYFHIDHNVLVEVEKYGNKWLPLNASSEQKEQAISDQKTRNLDLLSNMSFPSIKSISPKSLSEQLMPLIPQSKPSNDMYLKMVVTTAEPSGPPKPLTTDDRPNVSVDDCPLVHYITGRICTITKDNLSTYVAAYPDEKLYVGDVVYKWDMGGWEVMAGRAGEAVFRNDEYVTSKLTTFS